MIPKIESSPNFPKAILSVNRTEFNDKKDSPESGAEALPLPLVVKKKLTEEDTTLPPDLQGSVFIIAPVGCVGSPPVSEEYENIVLPTQDGWTSLLNGDGMMYRLDFQAGAATLQSRFVNTPSHYADKIAHEKYPKLDFMNLGLARLSLNLGSSNQVNTAFLPMKFPQQENERLLATWDVGRAYEIDPASLRIIAPVGSTADWSDLIKLPLTWPFKQLMTSAHPAFDPNTGEMFTANVVKSLSTFIWISRLFTYDAKNILLRWLPSCLRQLAKTIIFAFAIVLEFLVGIVTKLLELLGLGSNDALYLIRWTGSNSLEKWKVVLPDGRRVKIQQTVHQMGITQDYVILADTAFKIVVEDLIPGISKAIGSSKIKQLMKSGQGHEAKQEIETRLKIDRDFFRKYLSYPQRPDTRLYVIDRKQLKTISPGEEIVARRVTIQGEFTHYLVDYENPNGKIFLNAALNKATDPAEFIHGNDVSIYAKDPKNPTDPMNLALESMAGMFNSGLDINRPGFYIIDGATGKKEREEVLDLSQSREYTWSLGLYAYRDDRPTGKIDDIYWSGFGAWGNLLSFYYYELYKDYKHRNVPIQTILDTTQKGVPVTLNRLHIDRQAQPGKVLSIADQYEFPPGYFSSSPQFVPRANSQGGTEGYIVCTAIHSDRLLPQENDRGESDKNWSDNSEIWIFDAEKLHEGPQYRLSHRQLKLGFTLHSTWLKEAAAIQSRDYNVKQDFDPLVQKCIKWNEEVFSQEVGKEISQLFEEVYELFNRDRA